jgi:hypothetical protein
MVPTSHVLCSVKKGKKKEGRPAQAMIESLIMCKPPNTFDASWTTMDFVLPREKYVPLSLVFLPTLPLRLPGS